TKSGGCEPPTVPSSLLSTISTRAGRETRSALVDETSTVSTCGEPTVRNALDRRVSAVWGTRGLVEGADETAGVDGGVRGSETSLVPLQPKGRMLPLRICALPRYLLNPKSLSLHLL